MTNFEKLFPLWNEAAAFIVEGEPCKDWSFNGINDTEDGTLAFYTYGEQGLIGEYFIDEKTINNGRICPENALLIDYEGASIQIIPLFTRPDSAT